ncbi:hypothetical protein CR159_04380 [Pollutimonas subterranea]|uniref:Uncharacterized protein n=1 Tax=Pollutimonas subterranea TaxID=2045210 RepID=A0A2N4U780_9BURK|nr:hypothetical protein CR159_04380 [Pollutimonas subterranea]
MVEFFVKGAQSIRLSALTVSGATRYMLITHQTFPTGWLNRLEKSFQLREYRMLSIVPAHCGDIFELFDLADNLRQPPVLIDQQPSTVVSAVADGQAEDTR